MDLLYCTIAPQYFVFFLVEPPPPAPGKSSSRFFCQSGGAEWLGVVQVVRSHGRTNATRNLHFFAELGVRGTP